MRNRNFVTWTNAKDKLPEKDGRNYLIAVCSDNKNKTVDMFTAQYYKAGNKVLLEKRVQKNTDNMSKEERLLYAIFGASKTVEITENGFYEKVPVPETEEQETTEILDKINNGKNTVYWTELPLCPIGFKHPYDTIDEHEEREKRREEEKEKKENEALQNLIENDHFCKELMNMGSDNIIRGLICKKDEQIEKESICITSVAVRIMNQERNLMENIGKLEEKRIADAINNHVFDESENSEYDNAIKNFYNTISNDIETCLEGCAEDLSFEMKQKIRQLVTIQTRPNFERIIARELSKHEKAPNSFVKTFFNKNKNTFNEKIAKKIIHRIVTETMYDINTQMQKFNTMAEIRAPEAILLMSMRHMADDIKLLLSEIEMPLTEEKAVEILGTNEGVFGGYRDFAHHYGVTPDGKTETEFDPAIESGLCRTINGKTVIPHYGEDAEGNIVKYSTAKYIWDKNNTFYEEIENPDTKEITRKEYTVTEYKNI